MQKAIWITFAAAFVLINLLAEMTTYFTGVEILMFYRLTMVLGITIITSILVSSLMLVNKLEEEKPLSGHVSDTLGADIKDGPKDTGMVDARAKRPR